MTTNNEALKLANTVPELQSLLYDVDLMPEQLDPTGIGYKRMLAIVEAYKVGIQTGRDQLQKELAEMAPVAWITPLAHGSQVTFYKPYNGNEPEGWRDSDDVIDWYCRPLIPQPTMPPIKEKE